MNTPHLKIVLALLALSISSNSFAQAPQSQLKTLLGAPQTEEKIKEALNELADTFAVPTYDRLAAATEELLAQVKKIQGRTARSSDLHAIQNSWLVVRQRWELTEPLNSFSPAGDEEFDPRMDSWPVDESELKNRLNAKSFKIDVDYPESAMGMHAIEYMIFMMGSQKPLSAKHMQALHVLVTDLHDRAVKLAKQFRTEKAKFASSGVEGVKQVLTGVVEATAEVEGKKIGDNLLGSEAAKANPKLGESFYSKTTLRDVQGNIAGAVLAYSFVSPFVAVLDAEVDAKLSKALTQSLARLSLIAWPIEDHLKNELVRKDIAFARSALQEASGLAGDAFKLFDSEK